MTSTRSSQSQSRNLRFNLGTSLRSTLLKLAAAIVVLHGSTASTTSASNTTPTVTHVAASAAGVAPASVVTESVEVDAEGDVVAENVNVAASDSQTDSNPDEKKPSQKSPQTFANGLDEDDFLDDLDDESTSTTNQSNNNGGGNNAGNDDADGEMVEISGNDFKYQVCEFLCVVDRPNFFVNVDEFCTMVPGKECQPLPYGVI
jgi:hypothetical protein